MSRKRILIAALLFLAATCVKFALPAHGETLTSALHTLMEQGRELRQVAAGLGESVAAFVRIQSDAAEADAPAPIVTEKEEAASAAAETKTSMPIRKLSFQTPAQAVSLQCSGQAPSAETIERCAQALAEKAKRETIAEHFMAAQSAFTGYAIPENVCCSAPELGLNYVSPLNGRRSSGFGYRVHPISGDVKFHYGTDFAADYGTDIGCFADGTVRETGEESGYGRYVIVDHGNCSSLYAHCSAILVQTGDPVTAGQIIAQVGETGLATGPHLHFELRQDGAYLNPEYYCGGEG